MAEEVPATDAAALEMLAQDCDPLIPAERDNAKALQNLYTLYREKGASIEEALIKTLSYDLGRPVMAEGAEEGKAES